MAHDGGRTEFQFTPGGKAGSQREGQPQERRAADAGGADGGAFHVLVMADLSGRGSRGATDGPAAPLANRRPVKVDIDNIDSVIRKMGVQIHVPLGHAALPIVIQTLEDFHPDRLFEQLPIFARLRDLHSRLGSAATFAAAAEEVRGMFATGETPPKGGTPERSASGGTGAAQGGTPEQAGDVTFASLIGGAPRAPEPPSETPSESFIRSIVEPYAVAGPNPDQKQLQQLVADALGAGMRAILHHPAFQPVEAAWRSVNFLVSRLNTDGNLKVFLLDITREELATALEVGDLEESPLYRILIDATVNTPGGVPWSLLIGDYTFDQSPESIKLLAILATLGQSAGAPFVAGASPAIAGVPGGLEGPKSFAEVPDHRQWKAAPSDYWNKLRALDQAQWLALAAPRFLVRQPYGPGSDPVEKYAFAEVAPGAQGETLHRSLLWANPGFAVGLVIANAFLESEEPAVGEPWSVGPTDALEVAELPAYTVDEEMMPCAEAYLTDAAAEAMFAQGVLPLLSIKRRPAVQLFGLPSIAAANTPLAGRWRT